MDQVLAAKRQFLENAIGEAGSVVVAYSGGVDSSFLAAVAHEVLGHNSLAATAVSPALSARSRSQASFQARERGWNHLEIETRELERPEYARNAADRCYWCKTELFEVLAPLAEARGARMLVGTNADDLTDFRPGLRAAREASVLAPLADAGLTKAEIRAMSAELGLATASKPASPCLASRFAYGVAVTQEGLRRIDRAEEIVRALGFEEFRVRDHGDIARIEVPAADLARAFQFHATLDKDLRALGWSYVALDLGGFRSGSLNEVLQIAAPPRDDPVPPR